MRFTKKPVTIEAIQWVGDNSDEILNFCPTAIVTSYTYVDIPTLEGAMQAQLGDWIIKGVKGEFYPCKPDIFVLTYEAEVLNPPQSL